MELILNAKKKSSLESLPDKEMPSLVLFLIIGASVIIHKFLLSIQIRKWNIFLSAGFRPIVAQPLNLKNIGMKSRLI
jgi:hypothetical protein